MKENYEIYYITWQDIEIEICYCPSWSNYAEIAHLEIKRQGDGPLPITDTGYRSHFIHHDQLKRYNDPCEFVLAWLDHEAQSKSWQSHLTDYNQLKLI